MMAAFPHVLQRLEFCVAGGRRRSQPLAGMEPYRTGGLPLEAEALLARRVEGSPTFQVLAGFAASCLDEQRLDRVGNARHPAWRLKYPYTTDNGVLARYRSRVVGLGCCALALFTFAARAQTLTITGGIHTYGSLTNTTVTMSGRSELRVTAASNPIPGCVIHLNSADAWFLLPNLKPSVVVASYLGQVRVSGAAAVADGNCRVVQHGMGTVVIPQAASLRPLQVFSGPHFTGVSSSLSQYVYHKGTALGVLNATISSFKLKRGYMATFAQNESGSGLSKCYIAQDGDLEVSLLPAAFDNSVRFVYVLPWRWVSKKGVGGNIASGLNVQWFYNWNLDQNSSRDVEYVPIRQTRWWPGLSENWQTRGANQLLGYNEPDNSAQDAYMTVGDAIWSWPDLLATGLRVGSPAVTDGGRSGWLYPFIQQADAAGLRVDFVAVHYYWCYNPADPDGATTQMYNFLKATYDQVKRPLWVTEWNNGANWTGCGDPNYAQQQAAVAKMIAMLDNTPFVERYAIYNWVEDVRRVKWDDGSLTSAGVSYRDKVSPLAYVQELPDPGSRSIAQLRFETNTLDASGFGNNALAFNSPTYTTGRSGQAIEFDGTNHFLQLPPNIANSNVFSFAAWVYWSGGGNWQRIFDFGDDTSRYLFLTPSSGDGTLRFAIQNGGGEQLIQAAALPVGQWRHVAVTLSGSSARLYTNGVVAASSTGFSIAPSAFTPSKNYLGESQFTADPLFRGRLDEVLIADYALTQAQITALMTNTPPQFTNSIIPRVTALEGLAYSDSIAGAATDADAGNTLTYSKAQGPAWLGVAANGTLAGTPTSADGGTNYFTVCVMDGTGASAFAVVTIFTIATANGTWIADTSASWSETSRWSGGAVATGAGRTADFSTINITANRTVTLNASRSIGTLKFGDTLGSQSWTIAGSGGSALTLDTGSATPPSLVVTNTATLLVTLAGTNGFVKSGPGTLVLAANNPLSGPLNLDRGIDGNNHDGLTCIAHPSAVGNVTSLNIRNTSVSTAGGATLQLDGTAGDLVITQPVTVTCRNNSTTPTIQNLAGTNTLAGFIALGVGGNLFNLQSDAGLLVLNGTNQYVGGAAAGRTYSFSGAGDCLLNGPILNSTNGAPIGLTKSGTGTLTLMATNTYTNVTTVSGGNLMVNGSLIVSPVTVATSATVGGNGVIGSPVVVQSGGTLAPGSSVGKLTVDNSVTLQAGSTTRVEISRAPLTNDVLRVTGILSCGGTLVVTNLAGTLEAGDAFTLFEAGTFQNAFAAIQLPSLNAGLAWDTNTIVSDGALRVLSAASRVPTNLVSGMEGNLLTLSWPDEHIGWRLEVQTNPAGVGFSTNWVEVAGSDITNRMSFPLDATAPSVFYRMVFP